MHEVQSLTARKGRLSLSIRTTYTFQKIIVLKTNWRIIQIIMDIQWYGNRRSIILRTRNINENNDSKIVWKGPSFKRPYFGARNSDFFRLNQPFWLSKFNSKLISPIEAVWFYRNFIFRNRFLCKLADPCSSNVCQASKPY